jgi:hypothetical protein
MKEKIFVQIASYRDPELLPTLQNLLETSDNPQNLVICIAWQHSSDDQWDNLDFYKSDKRFKIIDIEHRDSKGTCWARNKIQQYYNDEEYTLQLDSHHRFIKGWDTELKKMYNSLVDDGFEKPLLTSYIPSYNPNDDLNSRASDPWWMTFDKFIPEGAVFFLPAPIPNWKEITKPIPSRFYSAHFAFTTGQFCKEVPHDPNMYFHGEEISIAVRAFTHGYDLFHPHKIVAWHEYTREGRTKQWDDDKEWNKKNENSHRRNRILFGMENGCSPCMRKSIEPYGFGDKRTLEDYERYSGINFKKRAVQKYTKDNNFAPNPPLYGNEFENSFVQRVTHQIEIDKNHFDKDDYEFVAVIFHDFNKREVFREDLSKQQINSQLKNEIESVKIHRTFFVEKDVSGYIVWPFSKKFGWCDKIEGNI